MSGNPTIIVGDRGRVVLPAGVRERNGLDVGTPLTVIETPNGIALLTRAQLRARVRDELAGLDLVGELISERRQAAEHDGAA
jgi:AbrB family looped-hinge helix DNA binding protein